MRPHAAPSDLPDQPHLSRQDPVDPGEEGECFCDRAWELVAEFGNVGDYPADRGVIQQQGLSDIIENPQVVDYEAVANSWRVGRDNALIILDSLLFHETLSGHDSLLEELS